MERVGAARDLVLGYVHDLNAINEAMRVAIPSLERLADFLGLARSRRISRSGHVGTYSYSVHGAGCRFECDNGAEVDVDFAADGSEVFGNKISTHPRHPADQDRRAQDPQLNSF
ncbi:DUF6896 domain-containing protein [Streptomyces sp. NPDC003328]